MPDQSTHDRARGAIIDWVTPAWLTALFKRGRHVEADETFTIPAGSTVIDLDGATIIVKDKPPG